MAGEREPDLDLAALPTLDERGAATAGDLPRGGAIDRYLVLAPLGRGGMGVVVLAYDPQLDRRVALKLISRGRGHDDSHGQLRLVREAKAMARLSHPNVVAVYDAGTHDGDVFVAMEYCAGGTLGRFVTDVAPPWREVLAAYVAAGRGLAAAHAAGMVHRDFKPDNVLRAGDGTVKVSDFGLVTAAHEEAGDAPVTGPASERGDDHAPGASASAVLTALTRTGAVVGTPRYMAPEQFVTGDVDARSDQFSFCAALVEALWRPRVPRQATFAALVAGDELTLPGRDDAVPLAVQAAIRRGLALEPTARHPSMAALLDQLTVAAPGQRRAPWVAAALATGGVAVAAALWPRSAPATCAVPDLAAVVGWSPAAKARLRDRFIATKATFAAAAAADAVAELDAYFTGWAAADVDACRSARTVDRRDDARARQRLACLGRRRDDAVALVTELTVHADLAAVAQASQAIAGLAPPADCATPDVIGQRPEPAPAEAAIIDEVQRALVTVRAQIAAGHFPAARTTLPPLVARAARLGYPPLWAEALQLRGKLAAISGEFTAARRDVYQAAALARHTGQRDLELRTWRTLTTGARFGVDADAQLLGAKMMGVVAAEIGDRTAAAEAILFEVMMLLSYDAVGEARAVFEPARAELAQVSPASWRVAADRDLVASDFAWFEASYRDATALAERAYASYREHLGPDHPDLAGATDRLALLAFELGDKAAARRWFERSRSLMESNGIRDGIVASSWIGLASLAVMLGADATADLDVAAAAMAGLPPDSRIVLDLERLRGSLALDQGRLEDARRQLAASATGAHGHDPVVERTATAGLARTLATMGDFPAAEVAARRAVELATGGNPHRLAAAQGDLARILAAQSKDAEATPLFVTALARLADSPARRGDRAELAVAYAIVLERLGRADEAAAIAAAAVPDLRGHINTYYLGVGLMFDADHRWRQGDHAGAAAAAAEAKQVLAREGTSPDELAELAAWVRTHRPPRR